MPAPFRRLDTAQFAELIRLFRFTRKITAFHVHHTWIPTRAQFKGLATIEAMERAHRQRNFADIAQHITLDPVVAEVTQQRTVRRDGATFHPYGGSTIIIGPDGEVRYVIGKSVRKPERVEAQAAFVTTASRFWERNGDRWQPAPQPFMLLHERG